MASWDLSQCGLSPNTLTHSACRQSQGILSEYNSHCYPLVQECFSSEIWALEARKCAGTDTSKVQQIKLALQICSCGIRRCRSVVTESALLFALESNATHTYVCS